MPDIFGRNVSQLGGVFTADAAILQWAQMPVGSLVQQLNIQYAQSVTRLYGVGETDQYYVGGRTNGNSTVSRVIGPSGSSSAFYAAFGDVCGSNGRNVTLTLTETDCSTASGSTSSSTYQMDNVVIVQLGIAVSAQDMIIGENINMMFTSLELTTDTGPGYISGGSNLV